VGYVFQWLERQKAERGTGYVTKRHEHGVSLAAVIAGSKKTTIRECFYVSNDCARGRHGASESTGRLAGQAGSRVPTAPSASIAWFGDRTTTSFVGSSGQLDEEYCSRRGGDAAVLLAAVNEQLGEIARSEEQWECSAHSGSEFGESTGVAGAYTAPRTQGQREYATLSDSVSGEIAGDFDAHSSAGAGVFALGRSSDYVTHSGVSCASAGANIASARTADTESSRGSCSDFDTAGSRFSGSAAQTARRGQLVRAGSFFVHIRICRRHAGASALAGAAFVAACCDAGQVGSAAACCDSGHAATGEHRSQRDGLR
jgi:hypothetical protein